VVLNTPDANATTPAELAIAHLFSLCRHLPEADSSLREGKWERSKLVGTEIEQEANRAREELRGQVSAIAVASAEKILEREIDEKKHQDILGKLAAEL